MADVPTVTPEQRIAVLNVADINLKTVIDQVATVRNDELQTLVRLLNDADAELDRLRGA